MKIIINRHSNDFSYTLDKQHKFYADVFSHDDDHYLIIMTGVTFNFKGIDKAANIKYCISEYEKKGNAFIKDFRGSFAGALFDKRNKKWLIFTNQFGDQHLFYSQTKDDIIISSSIFELNAILTSQAIHYTLDVESAYQLLSYGYFIGDRTLIKHIKRIQPGHCLDIKNGTLKNTAYFTVDNTPNTSLSTSDCIEQLDHLFKQAITRGFEKDVSYGLKHFATLSGGLDSRMVVWVAHELGYKDMTTVTFSQHNYLDTKIAHEISTYLNINWMSVALDGGNHLIGRIDDLIHRSNALYHFSGTSSLMSIDRFSLEGFGLIHTGLLGDGILGGTHSPKYAYDSPIHIKHTSKKLLHKTNDDYKSYANNEIAATYIRGFNGILTNTTILQNKSDAAAPFTDVDFFNFCLSIPMDLRVNSNIYRKWLLKKHPKATDFKWENINAKISDTHLLIRGKIIPIKQLPKYIVEGFFYNIGKPINQSYSKQNMNPFNYWLKHNPNLHNYVHDYFKEHVDLIEHKALKKDCEELFSNGNAVEKMQVLTLLSAIKQFNTTP